MSTLTLQKVSKYFKNTHAVQNVHLEVQSGEFFSILGPSGCGKTTLLRLIAGFEQPTSGKIIVGGKDITSVPPQERAIGMVFQNYALFPHMTVFQNVAFGLETQKIPKDNIHSRVRKILEAVHLTDKMNTPVPNLSGGEQQRVAVARALVVEPAVLLFDEPLSNLDAALRWKTREEIRILQRRTGITTIYVTHDQSEAMSLSDRVAVMRSGRIEQTGSPIQMYEAPSSAFVAEFLGGANIISGRIDRRTRKLVVGGFSLSVPRTVKLDGMDKITLAVKPEAIILFPTRKKNSCEGTIVHCEYLGFITNLVVECAGLSLRASAISSTITKDLVHAQKVHFGFDWLRCTILSRTGNA